MPGEHLDLSSEPNLERAAASKPSRDARRYVGMKFECCDVYTRIYINRDETAYQGNCPRCGKKVELLVGPGGTETRFFTAF